MVFMLSIEPKSTGGMTHRRGMDELQRAKFILSTPLCSQIKCALELLTGIKYSTSEQHKSSSNSRIERDYADAVKVLFNSKKPIQ